MPEIQKMLVVSTANLTQDECEDALFWASADIGAISFQKGDYGYFVYAHSEIDRELAPNVFAICEHAVSLGCDWVCFDRDGSPLDNFPTYEW